MSHPHQCPYCPLPFAERTELEWHVRQEHPRARHSYVTSSERREAQTSAPHTPPAEHQPTR